MRHPSRTSGKIVTCHHLCPSLVQLQCNLLTITSSMRRHRTPNLLSSRSLNSRTRQHQSSSKLTVAPEVVITRKVAVSTKRLLLLSDSHSIKLSPNSLASHSLTTSPRRANQISSILLVMFKINRVSTNEVSNPTTKKARLKNIPNNNFISLSEVDHQRSRHTFKKTPRLHLHRNKQAWLHRTKPLRSDWTPHLSNLFTREAKVMRPHKNIGTSSNQTGTNLVNSRNNS